jgi:putative ABC transport system permease protein
VTARSIGAVLLLARRYLGSRRLATWVSMAAIALSLLLVVAISLVNFAVKKTAVQGSVRYPLVVGPEGASSVGLIFSTVFHIDKPTGTIGFEVYERLSADRRVVAAYPMAVADSLGSYPIVGTDEAYLYDLGVGTLAGTVDLSTPEHAVLGAEAAARMGLAVGDTFHGTHGMVGSEDADEHDEHGYRVVGVLGPTGGPEDAAAYCSLAAVWGAHPGGHGESYQLGAGRLTAVLVRTANPAYTAQLEGELTLQSGTQGVDTGRAIRRLVSYLNQGERFVEAFSAITLGIAVALILVTLIMSLSERRKELALMRCLGIGRRTIAAVVMVEALAITLGGGALGVALGHVAVWWAEYPIRQRLGVVVEPWTWTSLETTAVVITLVAGQLLALIASAWTYRLNLVEEVARD